VAGYEKNSLSGVRGKIPGRLAQPRQSLCQILGVTKFLQSDDNSAIFAANCDQSEVKDSYLSHSRSAYRLGLFVGDRPQLLNPIDLIELGLDGLR
jgi:hypothetical protein